MQKIKTALKKARYSYRTLPDKKQYVEFFTALLTVPVLLTVIILNLNNLRAGKATPTPTPLEQRPIVVTLPSEEKTTITPQVTSGEPCKKEIGPISIDDPKEGETTPDNPLLIAINYKRGDYCAVVWAYRVNDGRFSDFDDKSIALYNPPAGVIRFQLKVKSVVTGEERLLTRTFTYTGKSTDTQPTASGSAQ